MAEQIPEVWEYTLQGKTAYGVYGPRDVLIFKSSESLQGPEIVRRREGDLTQEDKDKLLSDGISSIFWDDEVQIITARYGRDRKHHIVAVEEDPNMAVSYVMEKIASLLQNTKMPGVIIVYFGPGRNSHGDWCFKDGFISFKDIIDLYEKYFSGKHLLLASDCSYSGRWVELAMTYLDDCKIPPCAHYSRAAGKLLSILASCRSNEIPHTLHFSARACRNDKNTGLMYQCSRFSRINASQHGCLIQNSDIICSAKSFDRPCQLPSTCTWQKIQQARRLFLVKHRQIMKWGFVLVIDDDDIIDSIHHGEASPMEFGEVIKAGNGSEPPAEVKEWINREYAGHRCF